MSVYTEEEAAIAAAHASRRCISVNHLARLIISTVVDENMIDAVLDDADCQEIFHHG